VLYTGKHEQLVAMSIPPGGDIGNEVHPQTDQFIRVEGGKADFVFNDAPGLRKPVDYKWKFEAKDGGAVVVPAGTWHNVVNTSKRPLKVYTVYAPPHHPKGTVDVTKAAAVGREEYE
jgi:mannose-6-phosphate isomerase-like protein (cupin superfamily)